MKTIKLGITNTLLLMSAMAWGKGTLDLKSTAFTEKEIVAKDGTKTKKLVPVAKVLPGDEVIYVLNYKNIGKAPAENVVINNPIPKNMIFEKAELGKGKMAINVSVDGGKSFGDLSTLKVKDKLRKIRPALPADVTHVQWKVATNLAPSEGDEVKFRAILR